MPDLPFPTSGIPFYKGKLVSVPGATGLIGSWVIKILRESDAKVLGFLHKRPGNSLSALADRTITADFTSPEGARYACRGAEIVVNCAGITGGIGITKVDPVSYVGPATMLACNLIDACHREGVERMGFLSSFVVCGCMAIRYLRQS
jgi:nucleoside-diphosphate-sugar epimerase